MARRCFWPPERLEPFSSSTVSYPEARRSMNSSAPASFAARRTSSRSATVDSHMTTREASGSRNLWSMFARWERLGCMRMLLFETKARFSDGWRGCENTQTDVPPPLRNGAPPPKTDSWSEFGRRKKAARLSGAALPLFEVLLAPARQFTRCATFLHPVKHP